MARILYFSCTHCPAMLSQYPAFLSKIEKKYKVNKIVCLGDLVDWNSISYHEKHPSMSNASLEYQKAKKQVAILAKRFPRVEMIQGNHCSLTERQAITVGLPVEVLKDFNEIWELPKTWKVYPRFSELEYDGFLAMHGDGAAKTGQFGAVKTAMARFQSTVAGHLHAELGCWAYCNGNARVWGVNVGCGVSHKDLSQAYGIRFTRKPIVGCAVILDGHPIVIPMEL